MARICFEARFWRDFWPSALSRFGAFRPRFRRFSACFGPVLRLLKLQKVSELTYIILLSKISKLIYKPFMTKNSVLS